MESKLPKNWVETELGKIINLMNGHAFKSTDYANEGIPIIRMSDIDNNEINIQKAVRVPDKKEYEKFKINIGDILIGMSGSIGKYGIFNLNERVYLNQRVGNLRVISENHTNKKLIYYFIGQFQKEIVDKAYGGAVPNISGKQIEESKFPLPPLAEQNRIVEKLDRLFAQLETIKTSMAKVPLLLKDFRQQVLTQAVTGKLTNKSDIISASLPSTITIGSLFEEAPLNWKWVKLIDIAKLESGHTPRKSEEDYWINGNVPWISLQDIRAAHGTIINETKYMPNELGIKKSSARLLPKGTVCFCRDISVGYTTVMGKEMSTTQHFANWICGNSLNNMFLLYVFMSAKDFLIASGKGTTVGTIYMPALKELRILLPPLEEQQEIVNRVQSLFAKADAIEQHYKSLKAKIETLPQAILHKAFKGELSEQLDSDGDARELLKQTQELKNSAVKPKKATTKKVKKYSEGDGALGMVAEK